MRQPRSDIPQRGRPVSTREFKRVQLRVPHDLYEQMVASAAKDYMSLNSEAIRRLRMSYDKGRRA